MVNFLAIWHVNNSDSRISEVTKVLSVEKIESIPQVLEDVKEATPLLSSTFLGRFVQLHTIVLLP